MVKMNHQNFVPIKNKLNISVQNLSFSKDYHKIILKKWKTLVKDGDITEVDYEQDKTCGKCGLMFGDAVDMFKHIKDMHTKQFC